MTRLQALALLVFMNQGFFSQDVLKLKSGAIYDVKVLQITENDVQYRMHNNPEGPLYTIQFSKIESIQYENGITEPLIAAADTAPGTIRINGYNVAAAGTNPGTIVYSPDPPPAERPIKRQRVNVDQVVGALFQIGFIALQVAATQPPKSCRVNLSHVNRRR